MVTQFGVCYASDEMNRIELSVPPEGTSLASPDVVATRFYAIFAALMAILVPTELVLGSMVHLYRMAQQLVDAWPGLFILSACVAYVRWRPLHKAIEAAQLVLVCCLTFYVMGLLIHIAGRSPYPLVDQQLANIDATLHFHTVYVVRQIARWPVLHIALAIIYGTTGFMVIAAAIVPAILGRAEYSYRFVLAIILAIIMTALLFHRWPAVGPWTVEGFAPARDQAQVGTYLLRLRSTLPMMDMETVAIVSFPSFHTVMAVTSAYALRCIRRLRWFTWTLAALICVSTITTGWHYGVDILAGLAIAVLSISMADRAMRAPSARRKNSKLPLTAF